VRCLLPDVSACQRAGQEGLPEVPSGEDTGHDGPGADLDKNGMPCKDRGVCWPERCVNAFEYEEMKRLR